jgi:hypothetical protein
MTSQINPLDWPKDYELNDELVLVSRNISQIWVPLDEELRREVTFMHHDGQIAGHLGMEGTPEIIM